MQEEILAKYPKLKLKVYVVWEPMLPTDSLRRTRDDLITDPRAVHFKDTERISGKWFAKNLRAATRLQVIAWDVFYLFDEKAKWEETPGAPLARGSPVVDNWEKLEKALAPLLAK